MTLILAGPGSGPGEPRTILARGLPEMRNRTTVPTINVMESLRRHTNHNRNTP